MRRRILLTILFALIFGYGFASTAYRRTILPDTPKAVDTIDTRLYNYAKSAPSDIALDIDKLVEYLKQPASNQRDMVTIFSYWIMQNISYDIDGFLNGNFNTEGPEGTLRRKIGVCQDYSELFKAMCDRANIKCYFIAGYAKAFDYMPGSNFKKANHAWNIVCLDNTFYPMDLTWSSGYVMYVDNALRYFIKPDISHVFASPEAFIEKHLPTDPKWQLLNYPVSMQAFTKFNSSGEMLHDSTRYYSYKDTITTFESLDKDAQEIQSANAAYNFYPILSDFAYHYYNLAVTYSNTATDYYNAAVSCYNKSVTDNNGTPVASGAYNKTGVNNAIDYYSRAVNLLMKIRNYADNNINAGELLGKCNTGLDDANLMLTTFK
ncbi:MAG: transglutaminase domain-containing protein [Sphingobacteriales bacterium]